MTKRVIGSDRAERIFRDYARAYGRQGRIPENDVNLIGHVERQLASHVGAASARSLVSGVVEGETVSLDSVIALLDEKQEVVRYSQELERKSQELEQTAEALRLANDQLTRLDRMKDDFLSQVSHELRTPMTAIRSFAEILVSPEGLKGEDERRFLNIIHGESKRLTKLLDEILELGRLEQGSADLDLRVLDAAAVARRSIETMQGLAMAESVEIVDALGQERLPVLADEDRLAQVFVNLLSNAIKFNGSADATAWVEYMPDVRPGFVEIRVCDNGPGISEAERETVFSKFARGWSEGTKKRGGSGLGLPICRQIMNHLGGELTLLDASGRGCTFAILIPAADLAALDTGPSEAGSVAAE